MHVEAVKRHWCSLKALCLGNATYRLLLAETGRMHEVRHYDGWCASGACKPRRAWQAFKALHVRSARDQHKVSFLDGGWRFSGYDRCVAH